MRGCYTKQIIGDDGAYEFSSSNLRQINNNVGRKCRISDVKIHQGSRWAALMSLFQCFDEELSDEVGRTVDVL